ncbi:MAG: DUF4960 domain-containing protein [Bacteroidales bacterium]|nr:DUF4960 domain-containing protein [Bacteroidales bacterium]
MKAIYTACIMAAMAVAPVAAPAQNTFKPLEKVTGIAFLQSDDPNEQEIAAQNFFTEAYPSATVLAPADFNAGSLSAIKTVWIHVDRAGLEKGWQNVAAHYGEGFIETLTKYSKDGGDLYLSGQAVQLLVGMGRIDSEPTIYGSNANTVDLKDTWSISANIIDSNHADQAGHALFGTLYDDYEGYFVPLTNLDKGIYPMLAHTDGAQLFVDDNNCMWQSENLDDFRRENNAQVIGTWGQNSGDNVKEFGIVEFLPDDAYTIDNVVKRGWKGNVIANGMACCEWAPQGENLYAANLRDLSFNTLNYLRKSYLDEVTSGIGGVEIDSVGDAPVYYTVDGMCVAVPSAPGLYIVVENGKATKQYIY